MQIAFAMQEGVTPFSAKDDIQVFTNMNNNYFPPRPQRL